MFRDLLKGLLKKNPKERITWEEFFEHEWFTIDEITEAENKLLEISVHKNAILPKLNDFQLSREQFSQFKHKSIIESKIVKIVMKVIKVIIFLQCSFQKNLKM